jgi:hypothetical protein
MMLDRLRDLLGRNRTPSRLEVAPDQVWISAKAKFNGIGKEVERSIANGTAMIALVAHFPDVLPELERIAAGYPGPGSVRAVLARQLSPEAAARTALAESAAIDLIVAEHHPLASEDAQLVRFAEALPCRSRIVYHVSLEDPLMQRFGGDRVRALMDRMGETEDEPIVHALVSRSLQKAQARIEAECTGHHDADSAGQWLERNLNQ